MRNTHPPPTNAIIKLGRGQKKETMDSTSGVCWKGNAFITA